MSVLDYDNKMMSYVNQWHKMLGKSVWGCNCFYCKMNNNNNNNNNVSASPIDKR